jgi:hypothetical protein
MKKKINPTPPVQYTILKGGRTSLKDQITLITDLFQLRPEEQKILDYFKEKQNLRGAPVCYTRFKGQEREEFFCDKELEREKEHDRKTFIQDPSLTFAEQQQLAAASQYDREQILNAIRNDRQKYLNKLDEVVNETHVPSTLGYPPRLDSPQPDLIYGGSVEKNANQ